MSKKEKKKQPVHHRKDWTLYPSFTYPQKNSETAYIPQRLVDLTKDALRHFDFSALSEKDRIFYKAMKKMGYSEAFRQLCPDAKSEVYHSLLWQSVIGQYIFDNFETKGHLDSFFPMNDIQILPRNKNFAICFEALLSMSSPHGRYYYSKTPPLITIDDKEYKLSFSKHALSRIVERILVRKDYVGFGDVFGLFTQNELLSCSVQKLPNGSNAVCMFETCAPSFASSKFAEAVAEIHIKEDGQYKYKLGYSPIVTHNGFVICKTFLSVGMQGTPEYKLLMNARLSESERAEILESIKNSITFDEAIMSGDYRAFKWFHKNGIPQIIPCAHTEG